MCCAHAEGKKKCTCVDKGVCVLLQKQVLQHATLGHEPKQVVITSEEDMQPAGKIKWLSMAHLQQC